MLNWKVIAGALALLLLVPSGLAWTQLSGDAGRTGVAFLPDGPMDVLSVENLVDHDLDFDLGFGPSLFSTPRGLAFAAESGNGTCNLAFLTPNAIDLLPLQDCSSDGPEQQFTMVAFDDVLGFAFLCDQFRRPTQSVFSAVDIDTGETVWSVSATDAGAPDTTSEVGTVVTWTCGIPALDTELGSIYVPMTAFGGTDGDANRGTDHRLAAVSTETGEIQWATFLDASLFAGESSGQDTNPLEGIVEDDAAAGGQPFQRTELDVVTRTTTGLVVMGEINDGRMFLNVDIDGNIIGFVEATPGGGVLADAAGGGTRSLDEVLSQGDVESSLGNAWAVANGPWAVAGLGNRIVVLDPLVNEPQFQAVPNTGQPFIANDLIGPALLQDLALIPSRNSLVAVDSTLQLQWQRLAAPSASAISLFGVLTAADGRIYTLENHPTNGERVVMLDLNGRSQVEWPLPINFTESAGVPTVRLTAAPGVGLLVVDDSGKIIRLGINQSAPSLQMVIDTDAPPSGSPVTLTFDSEVMETGTKFTVYWGDGTFTPFDARKELTHIYFGPGEKDISVVAVRPDGTTVTDQVSVNVDGTDYSWLQEQFLPENLDMTWGVIGIALGLIGGGTTIIVTKLRRRRMKREMDALETIRELAVDEPVLAMGQLRRYRADLRERAKQGKVDDPPFGSILQEVVKLFHVIEQRMLTHFGARMSAPMRRAMDAAFADGVLSKSEIADLQKRLKKEIKLTGPERNDLQDLLQNWV